MKKVLLVDDDKTIRDIYQTAINLSELQVECDVACDYMQMLEMLGENDYSLIILDYHLQGPDGLELMEIINNKIYSQSETKIPIAIFSADSKVSTAAEAGGADKFIHKRDVDSTSKTMLSFIKNALEINN